MSTFPIGDDELGNDFLGENTAASLGRISGPLLKDNLLRNGIDLAFETDLLYLDVTNNRIGINKANPSYELDVTDSINSIYVDVTEQAIVENLLIRQPDTFSTLTGPINLYATGVDVEFVNDQLITSDLEINDNTIASFLNADIVLNPNGTGAVNLLKDTNITGDLFVNGNIIVDGDLQSGDNIIVGDGIGNDNVTIAAEFANSVIPKLNNNYTLGTNLLKWRNSYSDTVQDVTAATIGNIAIESPATIRSTTGSINVTVAGVSPTAVFEKLESTQLAFDNDTITSKLNANILIDPAGSGTIELSATTNITGNLYVTGNISVTGDLSTASNIIIGNAPTDIVTINTDFSQSIIPGTDNFYNLGDDANDSSPRRWKSIYSDGFETITNIVPLQINIDQKLLINGTSTTITALETNQDVVINPSTGITTIEQTRWQGNNITNLLNTPLTLSSTGIGYFRFTDNNAFIVPAGTTSQQRVGAEVGETRWNTEEQYLECFDGTVWNVSIGPSTGGTVTAESIKDLNYAWTLILG